MNPDDHVKLNLNQNLWGLVVGLAALGTAEHFNLCVLFWFGAIFSFLMMVSVIITTVPYTYNYWKYKMKRAREHC
jgi:hypothetical protein